MPFLLNRENQGLGFGVEGFRRDRGLDVVGEVAKLKRDDLQGPRPCGVEPYSPKP